jgi:uncharacterized membrane protein YfcA
LATLIFLPSFAPMIIIATILLYFLCLLGLSWLTSRKADNRDFFNARHSSPWPMVTFGMIGASVGAGLVPALTPDFATAWLTIFLF